MTTNAPITITFDVYGLDIDTLDDLHDVEAVLELLLGALVCGDENVSVVVVPVTVRPPRP